MKKKYSQPDIAFDSFSLSTSIAGNCEFKTNTPAAEACSIPMDGLGNVFLTTIEACKGAGNTPITDEQSYAYNGFCYHVPVENANLFNS